MKNAAVQWRDLLQADLLQAGLLYSQARKARLRSLQTAGISVAGTHRHAGQATSSFWANSKH